MHTHSVRSTSFTPSAALSSSCERTAGVLKDWLLIGVSVVMFQSPITALQLAGYGVAFVGVCWYNQQKMATVAPAPGGAAVSGAGSSGSGNSAGGKAGYQPVAVKDAAEAQHGVATGSSGAAAGGAPDKRGD